MVDRLAGVYTSEGVPTRRLSPEEDQFIANERLLTKIDYEYVATRYHWCNSEGQGLKRLFPLWESQRVVLDAIAKLQLERSQSHHPDGVLFSILKARQLGACLSPETQVLTADLRWVPLDTVDVGQELVAVDEYPPGGRGAGRRMRTTPVEARADVYDDAFELVFDTGIHVQATADHRWLTRNRGGVDTKWRPVHKMIVGDVVRFITTPWGMPSVEDGWMGGMLDGEGSLRKPNRKGGEVCVSQVYGPVYDRLTAYFLARGYASFHHEVADQRVPETSSKFGRRPVGTVSIARMDEMFRLLGQTRPTRFIGRRWWEDKELPGKRNGFGWARVVEIRPLGRRRMIDLQTGTKTFIAEGLVSHNSTLCASLGTHRVTTHTHVRALLASDVPDNSGSEGLFGMYERFLTHLPWWLTPRQQFHTKNQHVIFENGSALLVESGKSMKGGLADEGGTKGNLGRSKTFSVVHLTELSTWERPEQIDDGLMPAVPRTPRTLGMKESTAKGRHNWHHEDWLASVRGRGRFLPIFIPWYAEPSKYWLPVPLGWVPLDSTTQHAMLAEREGPKWLGHPVRLTREQLYWYEQTRLDYTEKRKLSKFLEEFAHDPEACFQSSGRSIFGIEDLQYLDSLAKPPIDVWSVNPARELAELRHSELDQIRRTKALAEMAAEIRHPIEFDGRTHDPEPADPLMPAVR